MPLGEDENGVVEHVNGNGYVFNHCLMIYKVKNFRSAEEQSRF